MPFKFVNRISCIVNRKKKNMPDEPALPAGRPLTINYKRGFTLIELLIVIAIIGILSSFGVFSYQSSQKKARDSQRKSDLQMVKRALEAAKNDCTAGSFYPAVPTAQNQNGDSYYENPVVSGDDLKKNLEALEYMDSAPLDPLNTNPYLYRYFFDTGNMANDVCLYWVDNTRIREGIKDYRLIATLEITQDPDIAKSQQQCPQPSYVTYESTDYVICPN